MWALAWPVVLGELGWMAMGVVDTIMVGPLGPEAIGAVGLGSSLFLALAMMGLGLLLGLDTFVAQAYGAGRVDECHRWLVHGVYLALIVALPLMTMAIAGIDSLRSWGLHPDVLRLTLPYLRIVTLSVLPLLLYGAFRRYLQAMGQVRPVMFALVTANLVNLAVNWILIFGRFGAPALGVVGAAWATCVSRIYMALVLFVAIQYQDRGLTPRLAHTSLSLSVERLRRLAWLGTPAALQLLLETGIFAAVTALAGRLDPSSLAAHQIALNMAGVSFMVPLGVASAGAVRVGHAVGRRDPEGATHAGWSALVIGVAFMSCAALAFILAPRPLLRLFTTDARVIATGVSLLAVAALFQLFDGVQGVATGVLRGLGDTRTPMLWNFAGHWVIGLPLAYFACFEWGWGVIGLWFGLCTGLIIVATVLLQTWFRRTRGIIRAEQARALLRSSLV